MKRSDLLKAISILMLVLLLILGACAKSEEAIIKEFSSMIKEEPDAESLNAATKFIDKETKGVSPQGMSTMLLAYIDKVEQFVKDDEEEAKDCASDNLNGVGKYLILLNSKGERLGESSDMAEVLYVFPDYMKILETYRASLHRDMVLFLECKAEEERLLYERLWVFVDYTTYLEHTQKIERLIKAHIGEDVLRQNAIDMFSENVDKILTGSEDFPVFDASSGEFLKEVRVVYEDFAVKNTDSVLSDIISEYFDYLNNVEWVVDESDPVAVKTFEDTVAYFYGKAMSAVTK